jgi:hypothetical protein
MSEWETFCDTFYFDLWRVRRKDDRGFNDGYHLQNEKEAKALVELLNRIERERDFSRELHALAVESIPAWKERAEKAERERDEAIVDTHNYKEGYHIYSLHADFIERKLNETKKQIKDLISIAARAISLSEIDVDNDKFGIVSELRYELNQIMQEEAK